MVARGGGGVVYVLVESSACLHHHLYQYLSFSKLTLSLLSPLLSSLPIPSHANTGKGILAVDESTKTIGKRLEGINVENTEANRQAYRGLLFTTPNIGNYISGAILYEETLFQVWAFFYLGWNSGGMFE